MVPRNSSFDAEPSAAQTYAMEDCTLKQNLLEVVKVDGAAFSDLS